MNKIYKVIWSKVKNGYVVTSELAKSHTKSPKTGLIGQTVTAGVLACVLSCGAVFPMYAEAANVVYDDATNEIITLQGPDGVGTKITNLKDGDISAGSTDAVTGKQLYSLRQDVNTFQGLLSDTNTTIANMQTSFMNTRAKVTNMESKLNTTAANVENGFNVTISGAKVKTVNPGSAYLDFKAGDGISLTNDGGSVKLAVNGDGVVASGDTGAITGGIAYTELRPTNGNYVLQANTTAANLGALDTQLKTVTDGLATEVTDRTTADTDLSNRIGTVASDGNYIKASTSKNVAENLGLIDTQVKANADAIAQEVTDRGTAITNEATARQNADTALGDRIDALDGNAVQYDDATKAKVTLGGTSGTTLDNVAAGTLSANSMEAVNGSQLYTTNQNLATEISDRQTAVTNEATARSDADTILGNRIGSVATDGNYIKASTDKNIAENLGLIDTQVKSNTDAIAQEIINRASADTALSNRIGSIDTNGNYLLTTNNVYQNLSALDTQIKANADAITANKTHFFGVNSNDDTAENYNGGGATGADAIAIGFGAGAGGDHSIAIAGDANSSSYVEGDYAIGIGTGIETVKDYGVAVGHGTYAKNNAVALGLSASAAAENSVAIGNTAGISSDATKAVAIGYNAGAMYEGDIAIGDSANTGQGGNSIAIGVAANSNGDAIAIGKQSLANAGNSVALGNGASLSFEAENSVALGANSSTSESNVIAVGADPWYQTTHNDVTGQDETVLVPEYTRRIVHVSNGTNDTDAVNVRQLNTGLDNKVNLDASNIGTNLVLPDSSYPDGATDNEKAELLAAARQTNADAWGNSLGTGTVANGNNQLITGGTLYNETRPANSNYISQSNTVAQNLTALDTQIKSNADAITANEVHYFGINSTWRPWSQLTQWDKEAYGVTTEAEYNALVEASVARNYDGSGAAGHGSVAIGTGALTGSDGESVAVGLNAIAACERSTSLGAFATTAINGTAIGFNSTASAGAFAGGYGALADDEGAIAIGYTAKAMNADSIAIGTETEAWNGIAIGNSTEVDSGTAVGFGAEASHEGTAYGAGATAHGEYGVAIGDAATATGSHSIALGSCQPVALGENSLALGSCSYTGASAVDAVSLGRNADAFNSGSIAIGADSVANSDNEVSFGHAKNDTYNTYSNNTATYTSDLFRRLTNVADGVNDNDAATVGQLRSQKIEYVGTNVQWEEWTDATADSIKEKYNVETEEEYNVLVAGSNRNGEGAVMPNSIAIGKNANTYTRQVSDGFGPYGNDAIAIGTDSKAGADDSIAIGHNAKTSSGSNSNDGAVAIGHNATALSSYGVAIGEDSYVTGSEAVSIGHNVATDGVSIGHNIEARIGEFPGIAIGKELGISGANAIAMGREIHNWSDDGVAIGNFLTVEGDDSVVIGYDTHSYAAGTVALGTKLNLSQYAPNAIAIGQQAAVGGDESIALGYKANAEGPGSIVIGSCAHSPASSGVAISEGATVNSASGIAIGYGATAGDPDVYGEGNIAIGYGTSTSNDLAIAVGDSAHAHGYNAVALGTGANVEGGSSVAVGTSPHVTGSHSYMFGSGTMYGDYSTVVGDNYIEKANNSVVLGQGNVIRGQNYNDLVSNAIVIGQDNYTKFNNSVVIGNQAVATAENVVSFGHKTGDVYRESSGNDKTYTTDKFMRLTNVADGIDDHDVATVKQVRESETRYFGVNAQFEDWTDANADALKSKYGVETKEEYEALIANGLNIHGEGALGENSIAIGTGAVAGNNVPNSLGVTEDNAVAIGNNAKANTYQDIAIGDNAYTYGNKAIAIGNDTVANGGYAVAIGYDSKGNNVGSVAIGKSSEAATESIALGYQAKVTGGESVGIGIDTIVAGGSAVAIGQEASAQCNESIAIGYKAKALAGDTIALGESSVASGSNALAFGNSSVSTGSSSVAIGQLSKAYNQSSVAIGLAAESNGGFAVAVGNNSHSAGCNSVALGNSSYALANETVSLGYLSYARNPNSISIGNGTSEDAGASANCSIAIGHLSSTNGISAVALGDGAKARVDNSVALGSNSIANTVDVVSLGKNAVGTEGQDGYIPEYTRTIQHVTAGVNDTDAVNVSQLTELKDTLETSIANSTAYFSVNSTETPNRDGKGATGVDAMAIGDGASASGNSSAALGDYADAKGLRSIALGNSAGADNDYGIAIGGLAKAKADGGIAMGTSANVTGANAVALGNSAKAEGTTSYAIGQGADAKGESSIAFGTSSESAVTGIAMGHMAKATGESGVAIGTATTAGKTAIALGHGANASVEASTAIGINSSATANHAVALGTGSVANEANTVSIGNAETKRRIVNVGAAVNDTDAVNFKQVNDIADTKANVGLDNLSTDGQNVIRELSKGSVKVVNGTYTTVTEGTDGDFKTYAVNVTANGTVANNDTGLVTGGTVYNETRISDAGNYIGTDKTAAENMMLLDIQVKANADNIVANKTHFYGVNNTTETDSNYNGAGATGANAIAIGPSAQAGQNAVALGNEATADGIGAVSVGFGNAVYSDTSGAFGFGNDITSEDAENSYAFGSSNVVNGDYNVAVGNENVVNGSHSNVFGENNDVQGTSNYVVGASNVIGSTVSNALVLGSNSSATASNAIAIGNNSVASEENSISLGHKATDLDADGNAYGTALTRKITNLADGIDDSDAVTMKQYNALSDTVTSNKTHFFGVNSTSEYDMNYDGGGAIGTNAVAVGPAAWADTTNSIAIGNMSATMFGENAVAMGYAASALEENAVAIGPSAQAPNKFSTAVGSKAAASGWSSTAIGKNAYANGKNSIAIGSDSTALGEDEFSIGRPAVEANAEQGIQAQPEVKRRITHVDTGVNDTDAVNVKQLKDLKDTLDTSIANSTAYFSVNSMEEANRDGKGATGVDAMAIGDGASASGNSSAALGDYADAKGLRSIALGNSAGAENDYGIAIGGLAKAKADGGIAMGTSANVTGANALALGNSAKAEGATSYAIGQGADAKGESSVALGTATESAVTGVAVGHMAKATGESGVAIGTATTAGKTAIALGHGANASVEASTAIGINSSATANHAVALGTGSVANEANTVSFGNETTKRRLVNIANGIADSDAITVSQLNTEITARETADTALSNRIGIISEDKNYILKDNSLSDNLVALDTQLKSTIQNLGGLSGNAVVYDNDTKDIITLAGTGNGTKITNLNSGAVTANSKDAINGSQLYAVKQDIAGFATDIRKNSENIRTLNSSVTSALSSVAASGLLVDTMDVAKADTSLNNLSDSGKNLLKTYAANAVQEYMAAQQSSNSAPMAPMMYTGNPNTLSVTDAGNGSLHVGEGSYVNGTSSIAIGVGNQVNANNSGAFGDPSVINADASYVLGNDDTINTGATGSFIVGNDGVSDAKGGLLFGSNTKATAEAENGMALGNQAEVSAKNAIALGSGSIADTENTVSIGNSNLQRKIVNMADGAVEADSHEAVTGGQLFITNENVKKNTEAIEKKADADASNINTTDWATKLGIGKVEEGNKDLVTGGAVYNAVKDLKTATDFVKESDGILSIAPNSTATKIDIGNATGEGRILTGVVTDANDASSAANVGYVNSVATGIANDMNRGFNKVNDRLDKVGAGAAAMAGLVPGPMDGDEKWSFSAAVGNYRSATAGAIGAFYKPADNVMVAVKGSFGSDENMVSGGVGISLNKGNVPGVSKAQMVRTINAQAQQLQTQDARIQQQDARIAELEAQMRQMAQAFAQK